MDLELLSNIIVILKKIYFFILHLMAMQSDLQWKIIANSLEKVVTYLILFSA